MNNVAQQQRASYFSFLALEKKILHLNSIVYLNDETF